ncbi:MAG: histidine kinase, partial [Acidimicrobiales bacterium]
PTPLAGHWQVLLAEGVTTDALLDERKVPALAAVSAGWQGPFFAATSSLAVGSKCALCIPLRIHGALVGALLLEHTNPGRWTPDDLDGLSGLSDRSALMIDNARRFNSLWVIGGSEERRRVARDLHDHLGQRMAALGLELDGLARRVADPEIRDQLRVLRADLTGQIRDLRAAMSDLSCDVSERKDLSEALAQLVDRLNGRFSAIITLDSEATSRLALGQEHQLLLVARDMLTSAMVECRATRVELRWRCGEWGATLEVIHDGSRFAPDDVFDPPLSSHLDGLTQVQERCLAIGGSMEKGSEESGDYLRVTVAR